MKKELLLIVLICVFSCKCRVENTESQNAKEDSKMEYNKSESIKSVLIAKGNLYGSGKEGLDRQNRIIDNQQDWNNLLAQINSVNKVSDSFTETAIDFSKYTIIGVFDEVKTSGGHRLELEIASDSEKIMVNVTRIAPDGLSTSDMTQPYYLLQRPKTDLQRLFR
jgi:hypothetical protein